MYVKVQYIHEITMHFYPKLPFGNKLILHHLLSLLNYWKLNLHLSNDIIVYIKIQHCADDITIRLNIFLSYK